MSISPVGTSERALLEAAREGDERAFGCLVESYRRELHAHCYRMLGSIQDAEDALQDALLRAWRGLAGFQGRSALRSWLYRIATNSCLNAIEKRPKRALPIEYGPPADPHDEPADPVAESIWLEPYPDWRLGLEDGSASPEARYEQREAVELAFIAALQHLPANQRAVLILREVLGLSAREVAESLETTTASVTSALQRARQAVDERLPEQSQQATLRSLGDQRLGALVESYVNAWERGDADAICALLAEDATFAMPPMPSWFRGRADIGAFLGRVVFTERWRLVPVRASGQLAVACYQHDPQADTYRLSWIDLLTLRGMEIAGITAFGAPGVYQRFGLPGELPG